MAVAAQRFKFLDNETNIPIPDLKSIVDSAVYNANELIPSEFSLPSGEELDFLTGSLEELAKSNLENIDLESIVNKALSAFENLELPDFITDAFDFLKDFSFDGLKDFFKDVLDIGMNFLCNNLDFLKLFLLGFSLSGDVLAGLLIAYLLSLLDRLCESYLSKDRLANTTNKDILDTIIPMKNNITNSDIAFSEFKQCMGDFDFASNLENTSPFNNSNFLSSITNGTKETISSLIDSASSFTDFFNSKNSIVSSIESSLSNYSPSSKEYNNLLFARGELLSLPSFSPNTSIKNIMTDNMTTKLGKLAKALPSIEINPIKQLGLSDIEKDIFDKFIDFKQTTITERNIFSTRELNSNAFIDIDFSGLLPTMTNEIKNYLSNTTKPSGHRWRDVSPTTEVFFDDPSGIYYT